VATTGYAFQKLLGQEDLMLWRYVEKFRPFLKKVYERVALPPAPNFKGDRDVEYSWAAANLPEGPGKVLDFGCGYSFVPLFAARRGFSVTALDITEISWLYRHPGLDFIRGDVFKAALPEDYFDIVLNISSIEHVGLGGRYSVSESSLNGDLLAMPILRKVLKPGGKMILTVPVGMDSVFNPLHRVYGEERLPKLLQNWEVLKEEFWVKDDSNCWIQTERSLALTKKPLAHCFGLGLFVLRK
jgi:SAM-dependent methyltransferase